MVFHSFGYLSLSLVTVNRRVSPFTGFIRSLWLPQNRFSLSDGHLSSSFVTANLLFSLRRAPFSLFRYRKTAFLSPAGTFLPLSLPQNRFSLSGGRLSPSFVTAKPLFSLRRAPFSFFRYRKTVFLSPAGTFLPLSLLQNGFFPSGGHLSPSFVTAKPFFSLRRAPFFLFRYRNNQL